MDRIPRLPRRSTARGMALAAALLIALVAIFTAGTLWDRRQRALAAKQRELDNLALVLAEQTERVFETADLVLKATIEELGDRPGTGGPERRTLDPLLKARISGIPPIRSLTVVTRDGTLGASTFPVTGSLADAGSFRFMRDQAQSGVYVWRLNTFWGTSGAFIPLTRRTSDVNGGFRGLVNLSLAPEYFLSLYRAIGLEPGEEIVLLRDDGEILASFPPELTPPPHEVGGPMATPLRDHEPRVRRESGTRDAPAGVQLVARVYLSRFPLHVEVRARRDATLASWRAQSAVIGAVVLAFCALGGVLTLGFYEEVGRREQAERDAAAQWRLSQAVLDTVPHPIFVKDAQGRYVAVNRAMAEVWNTSPEQFRGLEIVAAPGRSPEEIGANRADDRAVLKEGRDVTALRATTLPDGRRRTFHVIRRPMRDETGAITGLVGTAVDETDRLAAEAELRTSQELLKTIFDSLPVHIWVKDWSGRLVHANRAVEQAVGTTMDRVKGQRFYGIDYRPPEDLQRASEEDSRVLELGDHIDVHRWETLRPGARRLLHIIKSPLRDGLGGISGLVGIAVDITEHTRAEEALRQSQQVLATIFDTIPHHVWMKDREGRLVHANRSLETYIGLSVEQMKGERVVGASFRPPEENARMAADDRRVLELGETVDTTHWVTSPTGERRRFHTIKCPQRDQAGQVSGLVAISMDITEHTQAEEALRSSQTLLQTVFDAIPLSVFVKDLDDRLLVVNPRMAARWSLQPEQLIGKRVKDLDLPADERRAVEETDAQVVREDRMLDYEIERTMSDGQTRRLRAIKAPLHGADGRVNGILGMAEDITERHRMREDKAELERQLHQVQKMETIGRLAGGVAHDFNNLLTPIMGYVDLARSSLDGDHPLQNDLGLIRDAASRAAELTRGLLSFSRSQVLTLRSVDLNNEIRSVHKMLSRVIGEGIEILLNLDPALDSVRADATQMHQLLMNLAVNARDAMPRGGKLVIETANLDLDPGYAERILEVPPGHYVLISVTDTGVGMTKETQARIFEPFFTTKDPGKGTGLGLSIVYGIVRQHQGTIRCYSEPGRGTSFKVLLPRHDPVVPAPTARKRTLQQLRGTERVLVVEDEALVRDAVCTQLKSLGYDVIQAPSPRDAKALLEQQPRRPIALLIADIVMPGQSGRELYAELQRGYPGLSVLYMSGYPRDVLADAAAAIGSAHFIGKPFSLHDLAETVRTVLENPASV